MIKTFKSEKDNNRSLQWGIACANAKILLDNLHLNLHTVDLIPSQKMSFHWPSFPMYDSTQLDVPSESLGSPEKNNTEQAL